MRRFLAGSASWTAMLAGAAGVTLLRTLRRRRDPAGLRALAAARLLVSRYGLDCDLTVLALPLGWLAREGQRGGFRPGEKSGLLAGYALPLLARVLAFR
jgi:hypothetical protein